MANQTVNDDERPRTRRRPELIMLTSLTSARKARGLTQQQLSDSLGIHRTTLQDFEYGRRGATLAMALDIARVLGCQPGELLK